jgi:hypothetical protein
MIYFMARGGECTYHCTRTSRADKVELAEHVANLVPSWPCGTEECNDRAICVLQLQRDSDQHVARKFQKSY